MEAVTVTSDVSVKINIINIEKARDIPAGASVQLSDLINGNIIEQATPLSAPTSGVRLVCKQAVILAGSTTTAIKVTTGEHNFTVGEFIGTKTLGKAYAIDSITTASGVDTIAVGTAIDTPTTGEFIYEMAAEAASNTSALKNTPVCISGKAFKVDQTKVMEAIPAYVSASVVADVIGSENLSLLKNIDEISY